LTKPRFSDKNEGQPKHKTQKSNWPKTDSSRNKSRLLNCTSNQHLKGVKI